MSAVAIFKNDIKKSPQAIYSLWRRGGRGWILSQVLRTFGLMSKQSTGLFLCRSLPRRLRRSLPLVVRIHFNYTKIKTNHKSDWFLFGGRGWIRTTEAE